MLVPSVACRTLVSTLIVLALVSGANAGGQIDCAAGVDPAASIPLSRVTSNAACSTRTINGYPVPDPACTPGAINPTVTLNVLQNDEFRTGCERNTASSPREKAETYDAYNILHPANNRGRNQICELDHLVSLELGGADSIDNIWPQCGPDDVELAHRYFKIKDGVENYLATEVRAGHMSLAEAQHGIARNWTQYIEKARIYRSRYRENDDNRQ
jgi:hypothetical protein